MVKTIRWRVTVYEIWRTIIKREGINNLKLYRVFAEIMGLIQEIKKSLA